MNRSMVKKALRLSRAGYSKQLGCDGEVTFVAVFPRSAFGSDVPDDFAPDRVAEVAKGLVPEGLKPVSWGLWWKPDDPEEPCEYGTAVVALPGWGADPDYEIPAQPDLTYVLHVASDKDPSIATLWDKPHRVKWAGDRAFVSEDPSLYRAATLLFGLIEEGSGFLPRMEGSVWGDYGGKWYLNVEFNPDDDDDDVLYGLVSLMDRLRKDFGAQIRLYGSRKRSGRAPDGERYGYWASNAPPELAMSLNATHFVKAMDAWPTDREKWELNRNVH